jgi:uncharacterized phage protein gp47/JayE
VGLEWDQLTMPYARPTLAQLRASTAANISAALPGTDALLRFSNLGIMGDVQSGLANQHFGYLDWISLQAVPYTATDEYLEAWGALKGVFRKDATSASGTVTFTGTPGTLLDAGTQIVRSDGRTYTAQTTGTVDTNNSVSVTALDDETGAAGNNLAGVGFALGAPIDGIQANGSASTAFTGGADVEGNEEYRARVLAVYQQPASGGNQADYIRWATAVPGVTRAWVTPNGMGTGTVVVYVMFDDANAAEGGFPQGTDGVAADEPRGVTATGDQLTVADAIYPQQPVTALVYAVSPLADAINFTITGLTQASSTTRAQIAAAITDVFFRNGTPGGTIALSDINTAIGAIAGTSGFVITVPNSNIQCPVGALPVLGTVTYA